MVIHKSETVETRINACQWYWSSIIHQFSSPRILLWYVTYYCDNIYIHTIISLYIKLFIILFVCICHAWFVAPQIIPRHCHRLRPAPSFPLYLSRTTRQNDKYNQWNHCSSTHYLSFLLFSSCDWNGLALHVPKNIKKSDRPPSPCGLHSLMTLDAVQPGSLIPAPSISIKAGSVQQRKQEPTTHTHKRWTGWMPWGCWKGSSLCAAKEHVLQYLPFQIVWICASSLFPRFLQSRTRRNAKN